MHTPVESVSVKDIQRAGRLLAEFIASLEADFVDHDRVGINHMPAIGTPQIKLLEKLCNVNVGLWG